MTVSLVVLGVNSVWRYSSRQAMLAAVEDEGTGEVLAADVCHYNINALAILGKTSGDLSFTSPSSIRFRSILYEPVSSLLILVIFHIILWYSFHNGHLLSPLGHTYVYVRQGMPMV